MILIVKKNNNNNNLRKTTNIYVFYLYKKCYTKRKHINTNNKNLLIYVDYYYL